MERNTTRWSGMVFCAAMALCVVAPASAGPVLQGTYLVRAQREAQPTLYFNYGCMIVGNNGQSAAPSLYSWVPVDYFCGVPAGNTQAAWDIYPVRSSTGQMAHVIKSRANGQCLIRANNGTAGRASFYLWQENADEQFRGFPSADVLISNGQAAWDLSGLQQRTQSGLVYYAGSVRMQAPTTSTLVFSPIPLTPPSTTSDYAFATFSTDAAESARWLLEFHFRPM
jgi:hypothetical protein